MVAHVKAGTYTSPPNPSTSELAAINRAVTRGDPLPSGWALAHDEGTVKVMDTGFAIPGTGERAWNVTVYAVQADLSSATVYINGQSVPTATRANGGILDRAGMSLATLPVLVPPASQTWTGKVEWVANDGFIRSLESVFQ